jgi:hypothetical protein
MDGLNKDQIGHAEGEELANEHGVEVIVYDRDEQGNVIGWHKELKVKK